jgi:hypothetical protein
MGPPWSGLVEIKLTSLVSAHRIRKGNSVKKALRNTTLDTFPGSRVELRTDPESRQPGSIALGLHPLVAAFRGGDGHRGSRGLSQT